MATDTALELVATPQLPPSLFSTNDPKAMIQEAAVTASAMADVIRAKHLYKTIGAKNHVLLEGWTMLGAMRGVFASTVWTRPLEDGEGIRLGWEARVEARTLAGQLVGAAEASCLYAERNWKGKDDYAVRSMAQTRATSKALRMPLGFILVLAGYEACPAEEMPSDDLTEPLKASIAAVQERKAAAKAGAAVRPGTPARVEATSSQGAPDDYKTSIEVLTDLDTTAETRPNYAAPPLCPACKSPVGQFASESKAHHGRKFWQCQRANDRVLELEEREPKLTYAQIYADKGVKDHWRSWAEPWPQK